MTQLKEHLAVNGNGKVASKCELESDETTDDLKIITKVLKYLFLFTTIVVISAKLYYLYKDRLLDSFFPKQLLRYDWIEATGQEYFSYKWARSVIPIFKPVLPLLKPASCGLAFTLFTWVIVYLDSRTPGVNPPSPFSKVKQRYGRNSASSFQLGYAMAILSGVLVFVLMLFCDFT